MMHRKLMEFWLEKTADKIIAVDYETLTENPVVEIRCLLDKLDLPWEDACLDFHKSKDRVRTVSGLQVRNSIYKGSSLDWMKYREYLGEWEKGFDTVDS